MSASTPSAAQNVISPNRQTDRSLDHDMEVKPSLEIRFPPKLEFGPNGEPDQDEEWCEVMVDGQWRRIRFHDYHEIYEIPGLYEALFANILKCDSPRRVAELLAQVVRERGEPIEDLRVLDLGAGNGLVAESLTAQGADHIMGLDIIEEAKVAAERDRPGVYTEYLVADMTNLAKEQHAAIKNFRPNCLATVAALGFGDIPPAAFVNSWNAVCNGGWVAFNLKAEFMQKLDQCPFGHMVWNMLEANTMEMFASRRYTHRLSIGGKPIDYLAFVGRKTEALPAL